MKDEEFMDIEIDFKSRLQDYIKACEEMDMDFNDRMEDLIIDVTNP